MQITIIFSFHDSLFYAFFRVLIRAKINFKKTLIFIIKTPYTSLSMEKNRPNRLIEFLSDFFECFVRFFIFFCFFFQFFALKCLFVPFQIFLVMLSLFFRLFCLIVSFVYYVRFFLGLFCLIVLFCLFSSVVLLFGMCVFFVSSVCLVHY